MTERCADQFDLRGATGVGLEVLCNRAAGHAGEHCNFNDNGALSWGGKVWPEGVPTQLYLIVHDGAQHVYVATGAEQAISAADRYRGLREHIYRVTGIEFEEMSIQRHVIREGLVPKGSEVEQ